MESLSRFMKYSEFVRKPSTTHWLLSVPVFSLLLLLSYSSWLSFFLRVSFRFECSFFSTVVPIQQLFSHSIDKNCMFLLCNGILAFLAAANSGLVSSTTTTAAATTTSESDHHVQLVSVILENKEASVMDTSSVEINAAVENPCFMQEEPRGEAANIIIEEEEEGEEEEEEGEEELEEEEGEQEGSIQPFSTEDEKEKEVEEEEEEEEEEGEQEGSIQPFSTEDEKEEEEEEEEERNGLSTEELNKKFEDFIRRMKEELRIEAQRQLVMV
ncbi:uncharacterized protein LOC131160520 [Malania oleifera]|uniref:uncharacterized protein LOC131160520 n=1 Tax=Malania oleifera TaxID=397392 RepID=UPI0025AE805E|nr:uncharacterized protein LOC131160520 [Malania oleifera]